MNKFVKTLLTGAMLSMAFSLSAQAATYNMTGVVTTATGAFAALTPPGTPIAGPVDIADAAVTAGLAGIGDIGNIDINVGGFCFSNQSPTMCPLGGADVPIISIDNAALTFSPGQNAGGQLDVTAFSPTFGLNILINFDFDAGTFSATDVAGALGVVSGNVKLSPVPLPAAAWLFGSALLGLAGLRRRS